MDIKAQRKLNNIVVLTIPGDEVDVQRQGRDIKITFTEKTAKTVVETMVGALPTLEPFTPIDA